jgi:hypothetical protein
MTLTYLLQVRIISLSHDNCHIAALLLACPNAYPTERSQSKQSILNRWKGHQCDIVLSHGLAPVIYELVEHDLRLRFWKVTRYESPRIVVCMFPCSNDVGVDNIQVLPQRPSLSPHCASHYPQRSHVVHPPPRVQGPVDSGFPKAVAPASKISPLGELFGVRK